MKIVLEHIGQRFNQEWIFQDINYTFQIGESYAILGANGSGKSTLLQVIAGSLTPSEGTLTYQINNKPFDIESVYKQLSLSAPYLELIEEFTLKEIIDFHFRFKRYFNGLDASAVMEIMGLKKSQNKPLKYFSSGMKQRTKLALAFFSDTPVLLLDEPATNLDSDSVAWYHDLVKQFTANRLLIICSNQEQEYIFCRQQLRLSDYKPLLKS